MEMAQAGCYDAPLTRLWQRKLQLETIAPDESCGKPREHLASQTVILRSYGLFGIRRNGIKVHCARSVDCTLP